MDTAAIRAAIECELALLTPEVRRSRERLEELLAPEFREIGASGRLWSRAKIIDELLADTAGAPSINQRDVLGSQVGTDAVLLTYVTETGGRTVRRSSVWVRRGQIWRIVHHQGTLVPDPDSVEIRPGRAADLAALADIERAAAEAFRSLGMHAVADDEPLAVDELARYQGAGHLFVADATGRVVGYLVLDELAGAAHIEQVSVHPDVARRRIGERLIEAADAWARTQGLAGLTLTTYEHVPWNAPYYARLGFVVVPDPDQSPPMQEVRRAEQVRGLDRWPRVAMRRFTGPVHRQHR